MFENCENFTYVDLSSFKNVKIKTFNDIFKGCNNLNKIKINDNFLELIEDQIDENIELIIEN